MFQNVSKCNCYVGRQTNNYELRQCSFEVFCWSGTGSRQPVVADDSEDKVSQDALQKLGLLTNNWPSYFLLLINFNNSPRPLCYSSLNLLHVPFTAKAIGRKAFLFAVPTVRSLFPQNTGYYHPLVLLNSVSKLISFPFPVSHVPHLARPAPLTQACLNLCAL